jgi:hypothetical protein
MIQRLLLIYCFFFVVSLEAKHKHQDFTYDFVVCAIFNEDDLPYMNEWINFHLKQGVERFYLYNHDFNNRWPEYIGHHRDRISVKDWHRPYSNLVEWNTVQCTAYMDCIERLRERAHWCAFIDTDEFLFSPTGLSIKQILKEFKDYSAVGVNWVMFGTSFQSRKDPSEKITDILLHRAPYSLEDNLHIKSIVRPKKVKNCSNPHFFGFSRGYCVNENKIKVKEAWTAKNSVSLLRINHYWLRDLDYLINKKIPRLKRWGGSESYVLNKDEQVLNQEFDDTILKFN